LSSIDSNFVALLCKRNANPLDRKRSEPAMGFPTQIGAIDHEREIADKLEAADRGRPRWK
jgi:hypothetical protein